MNSHPATGNIGSRWQTAAAVLLLTLATAAVYARICTHEFTWWDDPMTLHHNPRYNPPTGEKIAQTWKEPVDGLYAPITYSYWGALAYIAEAKDTDEVGIHLNARVFHAGSLILHLASALVVFSILRLLSGSILAALGGGLLFAVHPVQVETVAWASGGKDLLCGLLSLCAIYQYVLFAKVGGQREVGSGQLAVGSESKSEPRKWVCYVSGAIVLLLAMLAKPSAMVVPVIVAVIDLLVLRRGWRKVLLAAGGWGLVVLPLAVVARIAQTATGAAPVAIWQRPLIAADAVAFYLGKLLCPVAMTPDYARRPGVVMEMWGGVWPYLIWLIPAGLAVWAWRARERQPWVLAGLAIFVAAFGPVLGLTPFMFQYTSSVADHYVYLPMFGAALVAAWALTKYRSRWVMGLCGAALLAFAIRSHVQLGHWQNDQTIWAHTLEVSPNSFNAPTNLAAGMGREGYIFGLRALEAQEKGRSTEAAELRTAQKRKYEDAAAMLERAVAIKPDYIAARHNAFLNYLRLGESAKAIEHLEAMLAANDKLPDGVRSNFTTYHDAAGNLWMKLGKYEKAAAHFEIVLAAVPDHSSARRELEKARAKLAEARIE